MEGYARFACLRGTRDNFRMDVESSGKRYSFSLLATDPTCPRLAVAESPIDIRSLARFFQSNSRMKDLTP